MRLMYKDKIVEHNITKLTNNLIDDLNLQYLCDLIKYSKSSLLSPQELMKYYSSDSKVISLRQDVFGDIYNSNTLYEVLNLVYPLIQILVELNMTSRVNTKFDSLSIKKDISWYGVFIKVISTLHKEYLLCKKDISSEILLSFFNKVSEIFNSDDYQILFKNYEKLKPFIAQPRAVTLGINLNDLLQPESFYCLMLNSEYFLPPNLKIVKAIDKKKHKRGIGTFLYQSAANSDIVLANTKKFQQISMIRKDNNLIKSLQSLNSKLNIPYEKTASEYVKEKGKFLIDISKDLELILGAIKYFKKLEKNNLPVCKPMIAKNKIIDFKNLYNPFLFGMIKEDIVKNSIRFDENGTLLILVGANKGGKTTLLQAIGVSMILYHLGFYVPCENAQIGTFDKILTHYQKEEDFSNKEGRLGFESNSFREIFDQITNRSFLLVNEPFTTTSPKEGEMLIIEVSKAVKKLSVNSMIVTHFYNLVEESKQISINIKSPSNIKCLTMGVNEADEKIKRTYKLSKDIKSSSYSMDIVNQYGEDIFD